LILIIAAPHCTGQTGGRVANAKDRPVTVRKDAVVEAGARYGAVAVLLHWLIAIMIAVQIWLGWTMGDMDDTGAAKDLEHIHISIGFLVLALSLARIGWRFTYTAPPPPAGSPKWERALAASIKGLFYVLLLAIPLSGWAMESIGPRAIPFFGLDWPHLPFMVGRPPEVARPLKDLLEDIHGSKLIWPLIALVALHVAGALKHQFDGRPVLYRMVPFLRPKI
jgi:cytochrome b561